MERSPEEHRRRRANVVPRTWAGLWAVRLLAAFAVSFVVGMGLAGVGLVVAGEGAFDSLWLRVPLAVVAVTAVAAGLLAGVTAAFAILRRGERSLLAFLPLAVLAFFAVFLVGELAGHE